MSYPEGMSIDVTYSPGRKEFNAAALLRNGEDEIFGFNSNTLSGALAALAEEIHLRYESGELSDAK